MALTLPSLLFWWQGKEAQESGKGQSCHHSWNLPDILTQALPTTSYHTAKTVRFISCTFYGGGFCPLPALGTELCTHYELRLDGPLGPFGDTSVMCPVVLICLSLTCVVAASFRFPLNFTVQFLLKSCPAHLCQGVNGKVGRGHVHGHNTQPHTHLHPHSSARTHSYLEHRARLGKVQVTSIYVRSLQGQHI